MMDSLVVVINGWQVLPCPVCGTEHRDDCPNKFERLVPEVCGCDGGCPDCDELGIRLVPTGGHHRWKRGRFISGVVKGAVMSDQTTDVDRRYWVETPWRSWGTVTGATIEEVTIAAEADRAREVMRLESQLQTIRTMPFKVESGYGE